MLARDLLRFLDIRDGARHPAQADDAAPGQVDPTGDLQQRAACPRIELKRRDRALDALTRALASPTVDPTPSTLGRELSPTLDDGRKVLR